MALQTDQEFHWTSVIDKGFGHSALDKFSISNQTALTFTGYEHIRGVDTLQQGTAMFWKH